VFGDFPSALLLPLLLLLLLLLRWLKIYYGLVGCLLLVSC
jgi:hypothetical protein